MLFLKGDLLFDRIPGGLLGNIGDDTNLAKLWHPGSFAGEISERGFPLQRPSMTKAMSQFVKGGVQLAGGG
jgi:hypothetical protein